MRTVVKCKECGDAIQDLGNKFTEALLCKECYAEIVEGEIVPAGFTIGMNPTGNARLDDTSFDIAVKNYES